MKLFKLTVICGSVLSLAGCLSTPTTPDTTDSTDSTYKPPAMSAAYVDLLIEKAKAEERARVMAELAEQNKDDKRFSEIKINQLESKIEQLNEPRQVVPEQNMNQSVKAPDGEQPVAESQTNTSADPLLEQWKNIYKNSDEYIYEILSEVPLDLIEPLIKKVKKGVKFDYIFSESAVVPKGRKAILKKLGFDKLMNDGLIQRKMAKNVQTVLVMNEKEACIMFPTVDGEADISEMFYSEDPMFHEWCLDYFRYCWYGSDIFKESKLKE